ncbi:MAG: DUF721 domain-containing protein [Candidatus Dependentiae bacterium]|nr:DUF721 domain-containing protein [Candidatus Dependentiae bacterium]
MIRLSDCVGRLLPSGRDWHTRLAREWHGAVGELAERMRLERVRGDLLIIGVYDLHWIAELYHLAPRIIEQINGFLGARYVAQLRFVVAVRKAGKKREAAEVEAQKPVARLTARHEQVLSSIKDGQLHDVLEKFFYASVR